MAIIIIFINCLFRKMNCFCFFFLYSNSDRAVSMEKICPTYLVRRSSVALGTFQEIIPNRRYHCPKQLCYIGRISFDLGKVSYSIFNQKKNFISSQKALKLIDITFLEIQMSRQNRSMVVDRKKVVSKILSGLHMRPFTRNT